jgi:glycosyltransferase involved in cell wall biosynthesis
MKTDMPTDIRMAPMHSPEPAASAGNPPDFAQALAALDARAAASPRNHWLRLEAVLLCLKEGRSAEAWHRLERITQSDMLGAELLKGLRRRIEALSLQTGKIDIPADYHRRMPHLPFQRALPALKVDRPLLKGFPFDMVLPPIRGNRNDFTFVLEAAHQTAFGAELPRLTVHLVAEVADAAGLKALAGALAAQSWPSDRLRLTLFAPEPLHRKGGDLRAGALRWMTGRPWKQPRDQQVALFATGADVVMFLAAGTLPDPTALERAARYASASDNLLMPLTALDRAPKEPGLTVFSDRVLHKDWLGQRFPFRGLRSLNFAMSAARFARLGGFDPRFDGAEFSASELGFRMFNTGGYFMPLTLGGPVTVQADHSGADADLYRQLCPNPWDRKTDGRFEVPKISIYIPAYKAARFIVDAVESVLSQDVDDLEVCIANDGSPDRTLEVLETRFGGNPKVRWVSNRNGGIGAASNSAIGLARGLYIGQLDSDDRLKPGAVRALASYLDDHPEVGCAYSSCERIDADGAYQKDEYSFPVFSREKMQLVSIAHHFRMFRRQVWARTTGFREDIVNAVDYDMFLKMSEVAPFHHVDTMYYQRRWHGANTSNVNEGFQTTNTYVVQRKSLERMGLDPYWDVHVPDPTRPRNVSYQRKGAAERVFFWPDYGRHNPYQRLLYARARKDVDFIGADVDVAVKAAEDVRAKRAKPGQITFHLHWLNKILEPASSRQAADAAAEAFLGKLRRLKWLGGKLVWTIHNVVSHDLPWRETEIALAKSILEMADAVHVHSEASLPEIEAVYPVPRDKLVVLAHGAYRGAYPDIVTRAEARRSLNLAEDDDVILFLGQIRPYKGVEQLAQAFRSLLRDRPKALLLLAGQMREDLFAELALTPAEKARIRICARFIDDAELQVFFRAADVAAYPYRSILTSGSVLLALSFGVPTVVPAVGMTRELLDGTDAGMLYDAASGAVALEQALRSLLARKDTGALAQMQAAASALAGRAEWPDFRRAIGGVHAA